MQYQSLISSIDETHQTLQQSAVKAVNSHITLRNWLIGYYIVEFEQNGEDRAKYGAKLLRELANSLKIKGLGETNLKQCRKFFQLYPQISQTVSDFLEKNPIKFKKLISQTESDKFNLVLLNKIEEVQFESFEAKNNYYETVFNQISFSHFIELIKIDNNIKRKFYELSVIKNTLSVRELERQIATLTYERVGLSANTDLVFQELKNKIIILESADHISLESEEQVEAEAVADENAEEEPEAIVEDETQPEPEAQNEDNVVPEEEVNNSTTDSENVNTESVPENVPDFLNVDQEQEKPVLAEKKETKDQAFNLNFLLDPKKMFE